MVDATVVADILRLSAPVVLLAKVVVITVVVVVVVVTVDVFVVVVGSGVEVVVVVVTGRPIVNTSESVMPKASARALWVAVATLDMLTLLGTFTVT